MPEQKIRRRPYGAPSPDGFPGGEEEQVAYCPREKRKKNPSEHRACKHHADESMSPEETGESAACAYPEEREEKSKKEEAEAEEKG